MTLFAQKQPSFQEITGQLTEIRPNTASQKVPNPIVISGNPDEPLYTKIIIFIVMITVIFLIFGILFYAESKLL